VTAEHTPSSEQLDEMDDAVHMAAPWEPRKSLCGQWNRRNLVPRDNRPDPWAGCWSCLQADDWIRGREMQHMTQR